METKVNVNNEISVDRLISLEKENASLQQRVGELKADKVNLEKKLTEEQKEVKVVFGTDRENYRGDNEFNPKRIETRNIGDIEELVSKRYKSSIEGKDHIIKDLNIQIEDLNNIHDRDRKKIIDSYENYKLDTKLEYEKKNRLIEEKLTNLKEELKKLKEDKTDEQETEKRNQEIIDLKVRIKDLEKTVKNLTSTNIFKRIWNAILDKNARIAAQKEIIEKEQIVAKIKGTSSRRNFWTTFDVFGF